MQGFNTSNGGSNTAASCAGSDSSGLLVNVRVNGLTRK